MLMQGKHMVITGATSGIGFETARALAEMGAAVTIISRSESKGIEFTGKLREQSKNQAVDFVVADLASQQQISHAAEEILKRWPIVDVLINNAGVWYSDFGLTEDHIERMFAVNHLSYFLLTHCLMDGLKKAASARVINVSSDSHFTGKMHWDDLNLRRHYHGLRAYGQSKLANVLFSYEFVRRNPGLSVTINAVHPGLVKTNIGVKHTNPFHTLAWRLRRSGGVSPAKGAATSVYLASSPEVSGITGKYWHDCKSKPSSKASYSKEDAARLWDDSKKLCGIDDYFSSRI
jgi:NAD(P)-dependent dehydrogenase (short-subunit alcohol dehydrogenase family)